MQAFVKVLTLSLIGGYLFQLLHIPIPWMLGPIVFVMLAQFVHHGKLYWPGKLADLGVVIVGTVIGVQFNTALFGMMGSLLIYMLLLNIVLIGGAIGIAYITSKWTHIPLKASVLSTIPGGLSQIVLFAKEEKVKEIGVISYFQVIRLLLVVIIVPMLVAGQIMTKPPNDATLSISLLLLIALAWGVSHLTQRIHIPVAFFITPILLLIVLQLATPLAMPAVPDLVMDVAQLLIGAHIGLMLKPHMIKLPVKVLVGGLVSAAALIALTFGSSFLMSLALHTSFATSFLSTAPGGLDQMVLLADAVHADASMVSMFQTFRLLFIFLVILPLMRCYYTMKERKEAFTVHHS